MPETAPGSRDETAFSIDAQAGTTLAPQGHVNAATSAMQALDRGDIDEAKFNELVGDEAPMKAIPAHLADVEKLKAEAPPAPAEVEPAAPQGDETAEGATLTAG